MRIRFYEHQLQRLFEEGNARQHGFGYETARSTKTKSVRTLKKARIFSFHKSKMRREVYEIQVRKIKSNVGEI